MKKDETVHYHPLAKHEVLNCKRCGTLFECKVGDVARCQCNQVSVTEGTRQFLNKTQWDCLCAVCLREIDAMVNLIKDEPFPKGSELVQDKHFYMENGFFVFTELYHVHRGFCCQSGCRHCAYGFKKNNR